MRNLLLIIIINNNYCKLLRSIIIIKDGIKHKLKQIKAEVEWIEKMDITCDVPEEKPVDADNSTNTKNQDTSVHDDFKREMKL